MRTEFTDIIYNVIQALDLSMTITDYSSVGTVHTIVVCDVKWAQVGFTLTIDGNDYVVTSIDYDTKTIVMSGTVAITVSEFDIYRPYFRYGSPIDANNELRKLKDTDQKYPLTYLMLNFSEFNYGGDSSIDREVSFRLFTLTDSNFKKWKMDQIEQYAMKPMSALMQHIVDTINGDVRSSRRQMLGSFFTEDMVWNSTPQYKFGVFITDKGTTDSYFADNLSGWEMRFDDLKIRRNHTCTICEPIVYPTGIGAMEIASTFIIA